MNMKRLMDDIKARLRYKGACAHAVARVAVIAAVLAVPCLPLSACTTAQQGTHGNPSSGEVTQGSTSGSLGGTKPEQKDEMDKRDTQPSSSTTEGPGAKKERSKKERKKKEEDEKEKTRGSSYISSSEAKDAALAAVGVSADEATFTEVVREKDDGIVVYDIEFYTDTERYGLKIDAKSGLVISWESDSAHDDVQGDDRDDGDDDTRDDKYDNDDSDDDDGRDNDDGDDEGDDGEDEDDDDDEDDD